MDNGKRLNIGILTERMLLGFGVDLVVHKTASNLESMGHSVTVFTTKVSDQYKTTSYRIVDLCADSPDYPDIFSHQFMLDALHRLVSYKMDAWIIETPPFYNWFQYLPSIAVLVEHGTPHGKFFPKAQGRAIDMATRYRYDVIFQDLRPGDVIVAISRYIRNEMPQNLHDHIAIVLNGGDHYAKASVDDARTFREEFGVKEDDIMILWVGRIDPEHDRQPYKGFRDLLKLAPKLSTTRHNIKIVAVGRTEDEQKSEKLLRDHGIVPGFNLPEEKMPAAFRGADIFLNTSKWEGFNLPVVEAQFQGTPVVAYNVCAHPEVVDNGRSGILVDDEQELFRAVSQLIADGVLRRRLAAAAEQFSKRFSWWENSKELERIIREKLKERVSGYMLPLPDSGGKTARFYITKARNIARNYGWKTLLKECIGWLRRRI